MGRRDDLIAKYANDIETKLGETPDMDLLRKVTIGLGPSIYNADSETVAASDKTELDRFRDNYLKKKLGLSDGDGLDAALDKAIDRYGRANRAKYRAVLCYMLCRQFGREGVYA
ncbi:MULTISPECIES: DUF2853 family protein [Paracoccus]|uniref:DUF2853 family protein n=1 Tax=Paracoccus TaxID=265 RepID=UPI0003FA4902|nr:MULTISPECIES: DUF2853 family protein [Paracoccus]